MDLAALSLNGRVKLQIQQRVDQQLAEERRTLLSTVIDSPLAASEGLDVSSCQRLVPNHLWTMHW